MGFMVIDWDRNGFSHGLVMLNGFFMGCTELLISLTGIDMDCPGIFPWINWDFIKMKRA